MKLNIKLPFFQFLLGLALMSAPLGCKTTKKAANQPNTVIENQSISSISYIADVRPIMLEKCTPCHFPDKGIKKMLDTYESTKDNIADILHRVQLSPNERKFMPYKSKNTPLTPEEISILKGWVEQGMVE